MVSAYGHRRFRSSEIHRLKALLVSFPTHYRSFWSREVLIRLSRYSAFPRSREEAVTAVSRFCLHVPWHRRGHARAIARWKANEQSFQTVYLRASETPMAPFTNAGRDPLYIAYGSQAMCVRPRRSSPSSFRKLGHTSFESLGCKLSNGILASFRNADGDEPQRREVTCYLQ